MKSRAPNVFRWTERMNVANIDDGEFPDAEPIFPPEDAVPPSLGPVSFEWRGVTMRRNCAPQSLWHFDRAAACARDLEGDSLERWHCLLDRTGGERMMALELARPMRRENNVLLLA
jgi:hypothetical protein